MTTIAVASGKGGVGKSTISINLSKALLDKSKKVLCIDFDHNNNCTDFFLRKVSVEEIEGKNLYHVLTGRKTLEECIHKTSSIDIIPATPLLACIEIELARDPGALLRFPTLLGKTDYDYIIIDTPPSISFALTAALYASNILLCPVTWSRWTIQGYSLLKEECQKVTQSTGTEINLLAIPSMVSDTELEKLHKVKIWDLTESYISRNNALKNNASSGTELRKNSIAWKQFNSLAEELL